MTIQAGIIVMQGKIESKILKILPGPFTIITGGIILMFIILIMPAVHAHEPPMPVKRPIHDYIDPENPNVIKDVSDPFEAVNRRMYMFNAMLDKLVYLPVLRTYQAILPDPVEQCISNFYNNVGEVYTFFNAVFQGREQKAVETLYRFTINSTVGLAGLFDLASMHGVTRHNEDLGQTLGYYGVPPGPYLMLPILGPSNLRDALGGGAESLAFTITDPFRFGENTTSSIIYSGIQVLDSRNQVFFRYYMTGSPFEYEMVRMLYDRSRVVEIDN
ncbi:MAG: VacJ family lipoprotein [Desulfamplus sp.]|nr:VacJ family lipoprotein [Desulfamplus sp.]